MNAVNSYRLMFIALTACMLQGCGGTTGTTVVSPPPPASPDVYVVGYQYNAAGVKNAMLWKNGTGSVLSDGQHDAFASSIAVSGSDVYVAGLVYNGTNDIATVWKNGVSTSLSDGSVEADASGIAVSGGNVYVSGGLHGPNAQNKYVSQGGYWKNGVFNQLATLNSSGGGQSIMSAILLNGSDVYVAGVEGVIAVNGTTQILGSLASYWKNGSPVRLSDGTTYAQVTSMALSGTDVYVAGGLCLNLDPNCEKAVYWKNGTRVDLSETLPSIANGIVVPGTVSAAGGISNAANFSAEYWSNGTTQLLDNSSKAAANGITASGSDVYVVGAQIGGACYWKNGILHSVTNGQYASGGYGIAVVQP